MKIFDIVEYRESMIKNGVLFCYNGYITDDIMMSIGSAINAKLLEINAVKSKARSVFSIFIEQMQNIIRYSAEMSTVSVDDKLIDIRYGMLIVSKEDDKFCITCGNVISNDNVDIFNKWLKRIKSSSMEEIKVMYNQLLNNISDDNAGSGVGFLDIAQRTNNNFDFIFTPIDDNLSYFIIKACV
jgi:hypothetical protein